MDATPTFPRPTIEIRRPRPDAALIVLGGEHDLGSAPDVQQTLDAAACDHVIVDVSAAEFVDSTIIAVLLRAKARAVEADQRFNVVLGTAPVVERALELSGVIPLLNVVASVEDALAE
jgi:anti-sigma B factor antagonist